MTINFPHMIVTAIIILVVLFGLEKMVFTESTPKGRKAFVTFLVLFVILTALNILWPYGGSGLATS